MRELYATIDLGSNSFHMLTAALEHHEIKILESTSEKVMLAEGLDKTHGIHPDAMQRGLDCIARFAQRIEAIPKDNIRIVGTNTLRAAINAQEYVDEIEKVLGVNRIDIVSGIEEARLIFLGVNHSWSGLDQFTKNLVIDIGGGSTEFIIGKNFKLKQAESLRMGCIAFQRYFPNLEINNKYFSRAVRAAKFELSNIKSDYHESTWDYSIGSAGTFKALERILVEQGLTKEGITYKGLKALKQQVLEFKSMHELDIVGLKPSRQKTIVPGLAITMAIFKSLNIKKLHISRGGLREGILYDLLGRLKSEDVRQRSITAICRRYNVPEFRSNLLARICKKLAKNTTSKYPLSGFHLKLLKWSAQCCRIGLAINHSQFQNHSAYLIRNSELSGFSIRERKILAAIVANQRRKVNLAPFDLIDLTVKEKYKLVQVIFLLRLASIIGKNGKPNRSNHLNVEFKSSTIILCVEEKWLSKHPLIQHALALESMYWSKADFNVKISLV
ncbi:Ppx/GppA family phosphatase [Aliikangiella marina]|uniref:Ppx/GppA family phosphatase n=1 Tax=Aliikangiella marina TaxID=1712262 RepID=A0A545T4S0_9GAMM|nr:Ppx/GppA phosphatase family protein [Aliikangiella marina]TQV72168.1 Ppx/GppA family phosphatase [Aliikangiella marina]